MNAFYIVVIVICSIYALLNFKHDIHMLQQNSYRLPRYWRYLRRGDISANWRLVDVAMLMLLFSSNLIPVEAALMLIAVACVIKSALILKKKFKKPLVFTKRVIRIYSVTDILTVGAIVGIVLTQPVKAFGYYPGICASIGFILLVAILSWAVVMLAIVILMPVELMINTRYRREAVNILRSMPDLTVIGVTGSYGKTSTKHYLHRILSESYETLMTPGSFNTPLGVIRTIREQMKPYTRIFICEMGAKQKGDVKEICDIVHPDMGIVTAVGPMHLETFKNIDNVQSTKFELVDALPADGLAVVNNDFQYCANRPVDNTPCVRYAIENTNDADYRAESITYSADGTKFRIAGPDGFEMELTTRLVGDCNISNLMGAVIMARKLGVPDEKIKYAVGRIEQVEHRLSIRRTPGGLTVIDDAFNSNPTGSRMALDVLSQFNKDGRRIVVTPGMIELGDDQKKLNREFGKHIGETADIAIVVGEYNRDAITDGIKESGFDTGNLYLADSFSEAQNILGKMLRNGDTVLYENDLPDSFK